MFTRLSIQIVQQIYLPDNVHYITFTSSSFMLESNPSVNNCLNGEMAPQVSCVTNEKTIQRHCEMPANRADWCKVKANQGLSML